MDCAFTEEFIRYMLRLEIGLEKDQTLKCTTKEILDPKNLLDYARKYVAVEMVKESTPAKEGYAFAYISGADVAVNLRKYCGSYFPELDVEKSDSELSDILYGPASVAADVPRDEAICFCVSANLSWPIWKAVRDEWKAFMAGIGKPLEDMTDSDEFIEFVSCDENEPVIDGLQNQPIAMFGTAETGSRLIEKAIEKAREIYKCAET